MKPGEKIEIKSLANNSKRIGILTGTFKTDNKDIVYYLFKTPLRGWVQLTSWGMPGILQSLPNESLTEEETKIYEDYMRFPYKYSNWGEKTAKDDETVLNPESSKNSKLKEYLIDHNIEMHYESGQVIVYIHFFQLEDFVKSCRNDECTYDFSSDEAYQVYMRDKYVCIEINDIVEHLEEDLRDYIGMCTD